MDKEQNRKFIKKTESLVNPEDVTAISFLGDFNKMLSKKAQHKIMEKGSQKIPYMGFIVDPYCLFLCYKIKDKEKAQAMLPPGYELAETSVYTDSETYPMVIFSAFSARTSAFIGTRLEMYIIARHNESGLLSWIISDYETNTNSHDPKNGFCGYTSSPTLFTTTPYGELLIDIKGKKNNKEFALQADLNKSKTVNLSEELWVEGNMSVDYGGALKDPDSRPFGLIFDPALMEKAEDLPPEAVNVTTNNYFSEIIDTRSPEQALVFPYSQHFIIKQDLKREELLKKNDLETLIHNFLTRNGFKTMKGDDLKKPLIKGMIISTLLNGALILFLLLKLLL